MPVTIALDPLFALESAGIDCALFKKCKENWGLQVKASLSGVKFIGPDQEIITSIKIDAITLQKLADGVALPSTVDALKAALVVAESQVGSADNKYMDSDWVGKTKPKPAGVIPHGKPLLGIKSVEPVKVSKPSTLQLLSGAQVATLDEMKSNFISAGKTLEITPKDMPAYTINIAYPIHDPNVASPAVPLAQAVGLYQRVNGSSPGSVYFLVADFNKVKMAFRWGDSKLSVRFEGKLHYVASSLEDMNVKMSKNYASVHLECPDKLIARRVLGAMIYGLGLDVISPKPDLDLIYNKGAGAS